MTDILETVDTLQTALLDLVDCGLPEDQPVLRRPTNEEKSSTRPDPTPAGPSGRTGEIPDPVAHEASRTESAIASALGQLDALVTDVHAAVTLTDTAATAARCIPRDEHDQPLPAPPPLPTRRTSSGHLRTLVGLPAARRAVVTRCTWLKAALQALQGVRTVDGFDRSSIDHRIADAHERVRHLARRHSRNLATARPTRCADPYGRGNHPSATWVCDDCRNPSWCDTCDELLPIGHDRRDCWSCVNARRNAPSR